MKKILTMCLLASFAVAASADVLTVANADFQGGQDANLDPTSWLSTDPWSNLYVWDADEAGKPVGEHVAAFMEPGTTTRMQQTITDHNPAVFAETYGEWTIGFEYGWRTNTEGTDAEFTVSLIDLATDTALASDTLTLSTTPAIANTYTSLGTASLSLNYDNTAATVGNWVALRIERTDVADAPLAKWNSTAWIDDVTVTAIPEPATLGMVALFGGGILFIRRKLAM